MLQSNEPAGGILGTSISFPLQLASAPTVDRRCRSQLELAVVEYIGWFNYARLHESLGDLPPAEFEALYATQTKRTKTNLIKEGTT
jgi:transposase InsO family protein